MKARGALYFAASFAFAASDLPANATKHDGQIWYYDYGNETLTLKAYFPYDELLHTESLDWETTLGDILILPSTVPITLTCRRTGAWSSPRTAIQRII